MDAVTEQQVSQESRRINERWGRRVPTRCTSKLRLTSPCSWKWTLVWHPGFPSARTVASSFSHVPNTYLKPSLSNPHYDLSLNHLKTLPTRVLPSASHMQPVCEHSLNRSLMGWQTKADHVCSGNAALWSMKMEGLSLSSRTAPPSVTDHSYMGSQQHCGRRDNTFYALIFNVSSTELCQMLHSNLLESDLVFLWLLNSDHGIKASTFLSELESQSISLIQRHTKREVAGSCYVPVQPPWRLQGIFFLSI